MLSIITPCYNEEDNVEEVYKQTKAVMESLDSYCYEHIFIDNASPDKTVDILKEISAKDKNVKIIINSRNFGHIRSPYYALLNAAGDAAIILSCDLEDPPEVIPDLIKKWEEGFKVVKAVKTNSQETWSMFLVRKTFYKLINKLSEIELTKNFHGFGLYDRRIIQELKKIDDPYPYLRGLVVEVGFNSCVVEYNKPTRKRGITKNNIYTLYDIAMLGIINHSKIPLRLGTMLGFFMSIASLMVAILYLILKLIFWNFFPVGTAPTIIALFFFSSVQLFFVGIIGEYVGFIYTQVQKRPLVIEKERINF